MNTRQILQIESTLRALESLDDLPGSAVYAGARGLRDQLLKRARALADARVGQRVRRLQKLPTKREIRKEVRLLRTEQLIPIVRRARLLFKQEPRMLKVLRVPPSRATTLAHAEAALAIAKALRPHAAFCHASGFARGFLSELRASGESLQRIAKQREVARVEVPKATWQLGAEIRDVRQHLSVLDADLRAAVSRDGSKTRPDGAVILERWTRSRKIGKPRGRPPKRAGRRRATDAEQQSPG